MTKKEEIAGYSFFYNKNKSKRKSIEDSFEALIFELSSGPAPKLKWQNLLRQRIDNIEIISEWGLEQDEPDSFEIIAKIDHQEDGEGLDKKVEKAKKDIESAIAKTNDKFKKLLSNSDGN